MHAMVTTALVALLSVELVTANVLWTFTSGWSPSSSATTASNGEVVIALDANFTVHCFRASSGELIWRQELPSNGFSGTTKIIFASETVAVVTDVPAEMFVLRTHSGSLLTHAALVGSPRPILVDDVFIVALNDTQTIAAFSGSSGHSMWHSSNHQFAQEFSYFHKSLLFLNQSNESSIQIVARDAHSGLALFSSELPLSISDIPLHGFHVFGDVAVLQTATRILSFDAKTGSALWGANQTSLGVSPFFVIGDRRSIIISDGTFAVGAFEPRTGQEQWLVSTSRDMLNYTFASPMVLDHDRLFVPSLERGCLTPDSNGCPSLRVLHARTGKVATVVDHVPRLHGEEDVSIIISGDRIVIPNIEGIVVFDARGRLRERIFVPAINGASVSRHGRRVFCTNWRSLYAIEL